MKYRSTKLLKAEKLSIKMDDYLKNEYFRLWMWIFENKWVCWVILTMVYSKSFSIEMDAVSKKSGYWEKLSKNHWNQFKICSIILHIKLMWCMSLFKCPFDKILY